MSEGSENKEEKVKFKSDAAKLGFNPKGMHPGVIDGRRQYEKVNTAKPYKSGAGKLAQHQKRLGQRRNGHSETIKKCSNPAAFKTPGSMKQHNS